MSREIKKHPLAIAWDEWIAGDEGQQCRQANTLAHNTNHYLENRLQRAFMAGAKVTESIVEAARKWSALQSVNAITAEDAAIQLVEAVGVYEEKETPNEAERSSG